MNQSENVTAPAVLGPVQETCPWLPKEGTGSLTSWEKIGKKLETQG